jgi:autotransporter-associated beta strand protein
VDIHCSVGVRHGGPRRLLAVLLVSSALYVTGLPASAQDATWLANPGSGDFNNGANWNSGVVPTGTAFFGTSSVTAVSISGIPSIGGLTFNSGASAYSFTNDDFLEIVGAGITINGGSASITNNFIVFFRNSSTMGSATFINENFMEMLGSSTLGNAAFTNNDLIQFFDTSTAGNATITNNGALEFWGNSTAGNAAITQGASGRTDFSFGTGPLGDNKVSAGSINGGGFFSLGANELTVGGNNLSTHVTGVIADGGADGGTGASLVKTGTGTMILSGTNTYTGATTVNGGGLIVSGALTQTSTLTTTGTSTIGVGATGSINVTGNLVLSATGNYAVSGTTTFGATTVNGTASLDGKIVVTTSAAARAGTYTLITATGGFVVGKTTFATTEFNIDPGASVRNPTITYDATHVYLLLGPNTITLPAGASGNQFAAAGGINNAVQAGANVPAGFNTLLGLSGTALTNALSQVSGEGGHGATQTAATMATNQFINTMFDPSIDGRGGSGGPANYAEDDNDNDNDELAYAGKRKRSKAERAALAAVTPRDRRYDAFTPRFSVWAAGYGGAASVEGNASSGTHSTTSRIYGTAVGADIRISLDTVVGLAMGGGGTSFNTADGLGGGSADLFQVGVHGRRHFGAAYVAGALAYGWQDVTTDRTVTVAGTDRLRANFNAHTFAARGETGYRFGPVVMGVPVGITPYAALQVTTFFLPGYSETAVSGSNQFALAFASQSESNVRTGRPRRQVVRDARRRHDAARPRRLGARQQHRPRRVADVPVAAGLVVHGQRRQARGRRRAAQRRDRDEVAQRLVDGRSL